MCNSWGIAGRARNIMKHLTAAKTHSHNKDQSWVKMLVGQLLGVWEEGAGNGEEDWETETVDQHVLT